MKRLTRSVENKVFYGVLGGIGGYLSTDPTAIRIVFLLLLLITGIFPFLILYILAVFIMPAGTRITPSVVSGDDDTAV